MSDPVVSAAEVPSPAVVASMRRRLALMSFAVGVGAPFLALFLVSSTDPDGTTLVGVGACTFATALAFAGGVALRREAAALERIVAEPLAEWTFGRTEWLAIEGREGRLAAKRHPKWIGPLVAVVVGIALVPLLGDADTPRESLTPQVLAIAYFAGSVIVAFEFVTARDRRQRFAAPRIVVGAAGVLFGERVLGWDRVADVSFDAQDSVLEVRSIVAGSRGDVPRTIRIPVPRDRAGEAKNLVPRLTFGATGRAA